MKKHNGIIILLIVAIIVSAFVACSSKPKYTDKEVTLTQAVTDEKGQPVTDANGEVVTEQVTGVPVTDENGEAVTEAVTDSNGTAVTNSNGEKVTQQVTASSSANSETSANSTAKTTAKANNNNKTSSTTKSNKKDKETTTKKPSNNTTKPNNTTTTKPTTTTTEPSTETTTEAPTAPDGQKYNKDDLKISVVLPYFANEDAQNYKLIVKIGNDTLKYSFVGCKGQSIRISVPSKYKGEVASFSVDVNGKKYNIEKKIKNNLKIEFETIIIVTGVDD